VPEVIDDGVSGFVVYSMDEAVSAVRRIDELDRRCVRATFEERFTTTRMAHDYATIYRNLPAVRRASVHAVPEVQIGTAALA
jgi:hypothetical protein